MNYCVAETKNTNNESSSLTTEQTPVLEIKNDRKELEAGFQQFENLTSTLKGTLTDGTMHDIKDFLARPRMLKTFNWDTTNTRGSLLSSVKLPLDPLTDRLFASKVAGFAFFRATMVVKCMINTQRFQAGRMLMHWTPLVDQNSTKYIDTNRLIYRTQRPRVEFDVSTDTEVVMKIPYVHPCLAFDLTTGYNNAGILDIVVYSPLTSSDANGNLYFSFEDVELEFATEPGTLIAQAGNTRAYRKRRRPQVDPGDAEADDMGVRPVSSMLSALATTARFGTQIPLISSVAGPVSWAAGIAAKAAHAFGYAKPLNLAPRIRTINQPDTHRINCDGAHMAVNLGVFEDNKISHLPGFAGTDVDEMAISSVIGTYAYYNNYTWTTTNAEGDRIINNFALRPNGITPLVTQQTITGNLSQNVYHDIPVSYVGRMFSLYRGSFKVKFKVVKTEFHSGRLRLNYYLASDISGGGSPSQTSGNVHSTIFDLRESTEFEVVMPFAAATPYLPVDVSYARFNLFVETPLRAVGDVSNSVDIIMEMAAADDFEFAAPAATTFTPVTSVTTVLEAQSGANEPLQKEISPSETIGGTTENVVTTCEAENCVGEKILSFRQLLKRHTICLKLCLQQLAFYDWSFTPDYVFSPYAMPLPNIYDAGGYAGSAADTCWWQPDYFTLVGVLYTMMRGSVRLSVNDDGPLAYTYGNTVVPSVNMAGPINNGSAVVANNTQLYHDAFNGDYPFGRLVTDRFNDRAAAAAYNTNYPDIQMPYYNRTHSSIVPVGPRLQQNGEGSLSFKGPKWCRLPKISTRVRSRVENKGATLNWSYREITRAIGEDFSFGYFTGTYPTTQIVKVTGGNSNKNTVA